MPVGSQATLAQGPFHNSPANAKSNSGTLIWRRVIADFRVVS
jgi:hypothetical protein